MKELINGNLKVIEIREGHTYEGKKLTRDNKWRIQRRFNATSINEAMDYMRRVNK